MSLFRSSWPPIQLPFKNATSTVEFISFLPLSLLPTSSATSYTLPAPKAGISAEAILHPSKLLEFASFSLHP